MSKINREDELRECWLRANDENAKLRSTLSYFAAELERRRTEIAKLNKALLRRKHGINALRHRLAEARTGAADRNEGDAT